MPAPALHDASIDVQRLSLQASSELSCKMRKEYVRILELV